MLFIKVTVKILSCICLVVLFLDLTIIEADANQTYYKINYENVKNKAKVVKIKDEIKEAVYNPDDLRELSNLSKDQIFKILEGSNLQVLSDVYFRIEKEYNVNAIFLMALNIEESGHGQSSLAVYKNNLGGVKSRDGGWAEFYDWEHSLEYIASLINESYLTETGAYYNGTSIYGVNVKYCTGTKWSENINAIANELLNKVEPTVMIKPKANYNY